MTTMRLKLASISSSQSIRDAMQIEFRMLAAA